MLVFASTLPCVVTQGLSAQLALQCATFQLLLRRVAATQARLSVLQASIEQAPLAAGQDKVVSLPQVRLQIQIRHTRGHLVALATEVGHVAADVCKTGNTLIVETRGRVVALVSRACRRSGTCEPALVRTIKFAIEEANVEIERVLKCVAQVSMDAK